MSEDTRDVEPVWRYTVCQSDQDRPGCATTVRQVRRPNGLWTPWFCEACDKAHAERSQRERDHAA